MKNRYSIRHEKEPSRNRLLADGKFALGMFLGVTATVVSLLLVKRNYELLVGFADGTNVSSVIALFVALASVAVAGLALSEQKKMREAGTDPVVVVHLGQREDARELATLCISNVGAGAAMNVKLDVIEPDGLVESERLLTNIFEPHYPFAAILQGHTLEFNFGVGFKLLGENPIPPFVANLEYEDIEGTEYRASFEIDVREISKKPSHVLPLARIANALEKMAN